MWYSDWYRVWRDSIKEQANQREKKKKRDTQERYNKEKKAFDERSEDRILEPAVFFGCEGVL